MVSTSKELNTLIVILIFICIGIIALAVWILPTKIMISLIVIGCFLAAIAGFIMKVSR